MDHVTWVLGVGNVIQLVNVICETCLVCCKLESEILKEAENAQK